MTYFSGKSCSVGLPCVSFVNVYQFVCGILSPLVLRVGRIIDCISTRSSPIVLLSKVNAIHLCFLCSLKRFVIQCVI